MTSQPLLRVQNLRVSFPTRQGSVQGVSDVSFDIFPGETLAIVGESGSGKSVSAVSLLRLVAFSGGEISNGKVLFDGQDLLHASEAHLRTIRGDQIGMIFQEPMTALNPVFTIERQLTETLRHHRKITKAAARSKALELLQQTRIPDPARRLRQYPHELSGGMRQRVAIAMALACDPKLLIADEPTTALDVTTQAEILSLLKRLQAETGAAILFITHDMAVVAQIADRMVVMQNGICVEDGSTSQIFKAPQHPYTQSLLAAVPRLGASQTVPDPQETKPLLEVKHLTTRFPVKGGLLRQTQAFVHAVEDVSFTLNHAETLAIVGESGCGKSTLGRSVLRLVEPHSGTIALDGKDITNLGPTDLRRTRAKMQMIFQDPFASLNPQMRVSDQVAEPLWNFHTGAAADIDRLVAELFDRVGLPQTMLHRFPHELSGGQRQRVAIARALALNPKLIVADEAVSALDVSVQAQVLDLLKNLQAELGLSYLFISHDMAVVDQMAHRIAVMFLGRIVEIGPRNAVLRSPQHDYTRALLRAVPVADPDARMLDRDLNFKPIPSPIHPKDHLPDPCVYTEVAPGHLVLTSASGY